MNLECRQEKYFYYNTLSILLKSVENERTTVDLRNEASIYGTVEQTDGYMNIIMKDCIYSDPRGDTFSYDMFFVQARNIRFVHIPPHIRIIPAIKEQLHLLKGPSNDRKYMKKTFKQKRVQQNQEDGKAMAKALLENKNQMGTNISRLQKE